MSRTVLRVDQPVDGALITSLAKVVRPSSEGNRAGFHKLGEGLHTVQQYCFTDWFVFHSQIRFTFARTENCLLLARVIATV